MLFTETAYFSVTYSTLLVIYFFQFFYLKKYIWVLFTETIYFCVTYGITLIIYLFEFCFLF